ncbi:MAG: class I SAM-dependent methyltransferase [Microcoleaceae cyanobacterium]
MKDWYKPDLAYIHDVGFGDYAVKSASGILAILQESKIQTGLIIDLGCGSGLSAQVFTQAGYQVLGIDLSESMIELARQRVPEAEFCVDSLFQAELPPCCAVTSIGECLNYLFDPTNATPTLEQLFRRVYQALIPGGVLIFDSLTLGQMTAASSLKTFTEGEDWAVLVEKSEDPIQQILTRRIITFRQRGAGYQRDEEVHRQRLYDPKALVQLLQPIGFQVEVMKGYGDFVLPGARAAFVAHKP